MLTGVDEPVDPLGHVHLEPQVVTHRGIAGLGTIGELCTEGGTVGHQPNPGIGVEAPCGGIAASQRLGSTIRELEHPPDATRESFSVETAFSEA